MKKEFDLVTEQRVLDTRAALEAGRLHVPPELEPVMRELISAPLTMTGLVDTTLLSEEAIAFARSAGMALAHANRQPEQGDVLEPMSEVQSSLFELFGQLFAALTGKAAHLVDDENEIRERMLWRLKHEPQLFANAVNSAVDHLVAFYGRNATRMFTYAKTTGGMRLVTGGQRTFGPSALQAVRITGLYADTQLIPDPIYPYLVADLHLNAVHLQLALTLFHILQLRPLVDAELPVPPLVVFPSFEEQLLERDAHTKLGIEDLALRILGPVCDGEISSIDDLFEYARDHDERFSESLLAAQLFIPPNGSPGKMLTPEAAVRQYFAELEGRRSSTLLAQMKTLPTGVLLMNGVMERLGPIYHLMENASEFKAQPLLSQAAHWHYFEKCAQATATDLRQKSVLSEQAFQTLRAIQDDSLSWLANVPMQTLAILLSDSEHRWLRDELNKYTSQLTSSGSIDTSEMVREVTHGLTSLVQRQHKVLEDITRKYNPKKMGIVVGTAAGVGAVAVTTLLPALSPFLAALPAAAALTAAGVAYAKEKAGELVEKRQSQHSMLGVLATIRPR